MTASAASVGRQRPHSRTMAVRAVTSAINSMRERLGEHQELKDAACAAFMSPFHFHRVFRSVTSATPGQFRTAMRMAEAKRLLIESHMSATDISVTVGYSSFGTFTSQFTKLVGMPPGRFRRAARAIADMPVATVLSTLDLTEANREFQTAGWVSARPDGKAGVAVVALFSDTIAQERPVACAIAEPPCRVRLTVGGIRGHFMALAASVRAAATVGEVLTDSPAAAMFVGSAPELVNLAGERADDFYIALREPQVTDPPVLTAFPLLAIGDFTSPARASAS